MGCTFSFVRSQKTVFQSGCTIFAFPPVMNESPWRSTSLLALGVFSLSGFSLLQDVKWCLIWISLVTELSIFSPVYWLLFFRQASVQVFGLLFVVDLGEFFIHSG